MGGRVPKGEAATFSVAGYGGRERSSRGRWMLGSNRDITSNTNVVRNPVVALWDLAAVLEEVDENRLGEELAMRDGSLLAPSVLTDDG